MHILSPFDPLVIQRKRLQLFFDYEHRFEAYVPKEKRLFGYFALPVLVGDDIVAALDLKTDRAERKLLVQKWTWIGKGARSHQAADRGRASPLRGVSARSDRPDAFVVDAREVPTARPRESGDPGQ